MFYFFVVLVIAVAASAEPIPLRSPNLRLVSGRIIGGETATIQNYPYQVSISINGVIHQCGGSIISAHHVLTAAHCTHYLPHVNYTVRAGSSFTNRGGSVHDVESYMNHEKHKFTDKGIPLFDVAVLRVKQPFHFDETRQPIELMDKDVKAGSMATAIGWGQMHPTEFIYPDQLQVVKIPIIDKKRCNEALQEFAGGLPEGQICAGYLGEGGKSVCYGDSGGPLVVDGKVAGIVSYGRTCAGPYDPNVFTEVAAVNDWIVKHAEL